MSRRRCKIPINFDIFNDIDLKCCFQDKVELKSEIQKV